jgi:hypothetical protein
MISPGGGGIGPATVRPDARWAAHLDELDVGGLVAVGGEQAQTRAALGDGAIGALGGLGESLGALVEAAAQAIGDQRLQG